MAASTPQSRIAKGKDAERKICTDCNTVLNILLMERNIPIPGMPTFQRRQNQSAVGGSDIENPFKLSIEVKAQETLAVNAWWAQCLASAKQDGGMPILLYKQNNKGYRCMMYGQLYLTSTKHMWLPITITYEAFQQWLKALMTIHVDEGWRPPGI